MTNMTDRQIQEIQVIWDQVLEDLQKSLTDFVCTMYLKPLKPIQITDKTIKLSTPFSTSKNKIEEMYLPFIKDSCYKITQHHLNVIITVSEQQNTIDEQNQQELAEQQRQQMKNRRSNRRTRSKKKEESSWIQQPTLDEAIESSVTVAEKPPIPINPGDQSSLNPKYTFESFVTGNSNSFAHAAAMSVADNPAKEYNPFFMYGGVGLGKTHLMHAIGHRILQRNPEKRVLYISSETFTNELIRSIRDTSPGAFRQKYRNIDVLLVDDVQFFAKKERIQEEFFHTFNTLKDANKQIILSSDRPPKEIEGLIDRLCSRFEGGLLADVQAPDLETRIAILQKKILMNNLNVPEDVMTYIASHIDSNIRELEGALTRVVAYASFNHFPITTQLAIEALKNVFTKSRPTSEKTVNTINVAFIQEIVSKYFKLTLADLNSKKRNRSIAYPRQIAMYLSRELTSASLPRIGSKFGGRDHTTVMHAYDKIKKQCAENSKTAEIITELRQQIENT